MSILSHLVAIAEVEATSTDVEDLLCSRATRVIDPVRRTRRKYPRQFCLLCLPLHHDISNSHQMQQLGVAPCGR
jgi:hypothetical protein